MNSYDDMNYMEMDVIKEVGSIGTGNAASALSSLLGTQVRMVLPQVTVLDFNGALSAIGNPESIVAAVMVNMSDGIDGIMLFILKPDLTGDIIERLLHREFTDYSQLSQMDISALNEVGNIMISSYVNALSTLAGVDVSLSVPEIAVNMLGGILSVPMAEFGYQTDKLMMIRGKFVIDDKELDSDLLMLPDIASLNYLMKKLVNNNG